MAKRGEIVAAKGLSDEQKEQIAFDKNGRSSIMTAVHKWLLGAGLNMLPDGIPKSADLLAPRIMDFLCEPPSKDESITKLQLGWGTPYRDRILYLTKRFIWFPAANAEERTAIQAAIVEYRKKGTVWRGDSLEFLENLRPVSEDERRQGFRYLAAKLTRKLQGGAK